MHALKVMSSKNISRNAAQHNTSLMVALILEEIPPVSLTALCEFYFRSALYSHKPAP
jgi:hypothetical protein